MTLSYGSCQEDAGGRLEQQGEEDRTRAGAAMKQSGDKAEEAGLLNPKEALAEVQASPIGAQTLSTGSAAGSIVNHQCSAFSVNIMTVTVITTLVTSRAPAREPLRALCIMRPVCFDMRAGRWLLGLTLGFVWMGVSSGLIILNKQLMSKDGFHYPMALSALGMSFSSVASYFCCRVGLLMTKLA